MNNVTTPKLGQIKGIVSLVADAVEHGSRAVERIHMATARRPFAIIEMFPVVSVPSRAVETVHNATVNATYEAVRMTSRAVCTALVGILDEVAAVNSSTNGDTTRTTKESP